MVRINGNPIQDGELLCADPETRLEVGQLRSVLRYTGLNRNRFVEQLNRLKRRGKSKSAVAPCA